MYRIYVEDQGRVTTFAVEAGLKRHSISGATIYNAIGYWKGEREFSLVIEFVDATRAETFAFAYDLKSDLGQEAVLVVHIPATSTLI